MNRLIVVILVIIAIFAGLFFVRPKSPAQQVLAFSEIEMNLQKGSKLIDVRTPEEYTKSHIVGATNIPLDEIQTGNFSTLNKSVENYVYCHSGNRATQATDILQKAGYNIVNLGSMSHVSDIGGNICTNC